MGYAFALISFILWAFSGTVMLRGIPLPGPTITCIGGFIGASTMLMLSKRKDIATFATVARAHPWRTLGQAVAYAGCAMTYQWSIKVTTVANAALTHSLQPLFTCLVFVPLLRKRWPSKLVLLSVVIGFLGLYVLLAPQLRWDGSVLGIALGTVSGILYSVMLVQLEFFLTKIETKAFTGCMMLLAALLVLPFALATGGSLPNAVGMAKLVAFGLTCFVVSNMFFLTASKRIPETHLATLGYLEPVAAIGFAALWLGEPLSVSTAVGGGLVLLSGLLIVFDRPKSVAPS